MARADGGDDGRRRERRRARGPGCRVIPLARPDVGAREEELVLEVLRSGMLSLGPVGRRFEEDFAAFIGTRFAAGVSSGTAGLHLAVRLAGVGAGDEVITSPFSFVASANCALYEGATPVFADIDPVTFNIDPAAVEAAITARTRAIVPVHVFGLPCDIEAINDIARRHDLAVVEDAAEAIGASRRGRRIGTHGNPAVFAFYPNKQMTTGEGGMVTTDDEAVYAGLKSLANQGRSDTGDWLEHDRLGFNYRLDDVSAAIGVAQVERLDAILARRGAVAARYDDLLGEIEGVSTPAVVDGDQRSWFVYVVELHPLIDRNAVMRRLQDVGVACKPYLPAIHLQPFYRSRGHREGELPVCESVSARTLAVPFFGAISEAEQTTVAEQLQRAVEASWRS
jgi:perosamine synthetase